MNAGLKDYSVTIVAQMALDIPRFREVISRILITLGLRTEINGEL